jgi:methylated-DNA-[protein]-cysteine S-methyltransferase
MGALPLPCLDLRDGTVFQQNVWRAIRGIPFGETQSYSKIANSIENTRAVRAVGGACGANPIPLIIPCHRVLAANHELGGFSGGISWKKRLLKLEGIAF